MMRLLPLLLIVTLSFGQEKNLPKVNLKDMKNKTHSLNKLVEGQVTLINFWATYCVPCRKEMKHLNRISETYADQNVQVIGISIDDSRTVGRVKSMVKSQKLEYTILLDTEQKLYKNFNTTAMPFSILVDANGKILWEHTGYLPGDEAQMEIEIKKALTLQKKS
ncbi:MAG: TlpA family protein disulfide reductase [Candidatus Marinimicrobia bacterium]|jgi:peroxiredoxin|nr:TlpA family protein disulfide reductase [Candidatus Neomarinimicrobiota bacterium]MBT3575193.1 TlpA family protein disulfide reductase [Candidatus Neomarinimicrobiota bacterium]MBT3680875.1 TlpA family protein disulfide reductase [Candidatus Neomarinimicrobiota bacterium]MBT3951413.1 TlpA family protein disulfide reductase [Candidatus Neomarinimicrobiota bacterium]MBT4252845.1 TlpA family protein disulfide reductase [Candidatus Neomarinimicrobiota bacterium]